jgi:hypothetical protein
MWTFYGSQKRVAKPHLLADNKCTDKRNGARTMATKFEVVPFDSGSGYFVHGGTLGDMFIRDKEDADAIAQALNVAHALKLQRSLAKVEAAVDALQALQRHLTGE